MGFLHGMLCSTSPRGLLPTFPSWSLVCLGKGNVYSPIKGLDHPGFLRDSNYLLPWDIPVPKGSTLDGRAWPSPSESGGGGGGRKGGKHRDKRSHKDSGADSSLRAYIGNEYECPRGHRFICSAPDKIVKATERSGVKETGNKLVTMDMPLYSPCACRSSKPPLGQLMRLFVVTPDTSLYIKLNPRVRPGAHPCPVFYPEPKGEGMTLPRHSMWVLRFPFVYVDESGPILPPTDNQPPPGAKMMKGVYLTTLKAPET